METRPTIVADEKLNGMEKVGNLAREAQQPCQKQGEGQQVCG